MPHFRTLRDFQFENRADDVRGAQLYDVEGDKLGKIDDVIFDHGSGEIQYAVVDTGGLLSHDKFIVPADRIHSDDEHPEAFQVDLVKKHVERFPRYDERMIDDENRWRDYEKQYAEAWTTTGDVLHREGTTNIVTPPPDESQGAGAIEAGRSQGRKLHLTPERFSTGEVVGPTTHPHVEESTPTSEAVLPRSREAGRAPGVLPDADQMRDRDEGTRWGRFRQSIRSNRETITNGCSVCERDRRVA